VKRKLIKVVVISLVIFSLAVNSLLGYAYFTDYLHFSQLVRLTMLVKAKSLYPVSNTKLIEGATGGIVNSLKDPYSIFLSSEDFKRLQDQLEGLFGGIGVVLDASNPLQLKIQGVMGNSPAEKAGLKKGDLISAINGIAVVDLKSMPAADLLKGPVGSEVVLSVQRGKEKNRDYKLKREIITLRTVESKVLQGSERIAYIKINAFSDNTVEELKEVWDRLPATKGMVLDLRDNPGGSLDAAVQAANYFLPRGPVVHLVYRNGKRESYRVEGGKLKVPLVVLVNHGSASASEILAAAIQDTGVGIVVGTKTFGKGVVQNIYGLGESSGLKLTTAKYLSPLGKDINDVGVMPDVVVEDSGDADLVLVRAVRLLEGRI